MTTLHDLGRESFVSLTTYRRSGETVATPVWVVDRGDALLVWTGAGTGKVKRLRNDDRVSLAPCSRRGKVAPDAPHLVARAVVESADSVLADTEKLLARKYGVQYRVVTTIEALVSRLRRTNSERVVLRIVAA